MDQDMLHIKLNIQHIKYRMSSVVFRVKSKGRVSGFCGRVMLGSSRVRGLYLHGSQLDIILVCKFGVVPFFAGGDNSKLLI